MTPMISRRGLALAATGLARPAFAQDFPTRSIRLIVPFAPGGGIDAVGRILAQRLAPGLGQPVVVENRTGAGGAVGVDAMAKSPPDGYTLAIVSPGTATIGPALRPNPYDPLSLGFVGCVTSSPLLLVCRPDFPAQDLKSFVALLRRQPDAVRFGSAGVGTSMHLTGELMNLRLGARMIHVAYRGIGPALTDMAAGNVDVCFSDAAVWPAVQRGQFRLLAVSSKERWSEAPDVPSIGDEVPDYDVTNWYGVAAPSGTPAVICNRLFGELAKVLAMPDAAASLRTLGYTPAPMAPAPFADFVRAELTSWTAVVRAANITVD